MPKIDWTLVLLALGCCFYAVWALLCLTALGFAVWAAIHFALKYW